MRKRTLSSKLTRRNTPHAISDRMQQYTEYCGEGGYIRNRIRLLGSQCTLSDFSRSLRKTEVTESTVFVP